MFSLVLSELRRPSIEKPLLPFTPLGRPFGRLPDEIIEQILLASDPNGFASLVVLNRKWRGVSQRPHLYLHHLARCPSYVASPRSLPAADDGNMPRLRRLFAGEIKRNLFEAFLRPNETVVKLVSNASSPSSSLGGEGMHFAASPRGHCILAYNSSRLYVIDVRAPSVEVKRELKLLRRPAAACITDDAGLLAVLSSEMQVELYDLAQSPPRRKQSLILDRNPRAIAISSCGSVLAAAYDGGIEVSSLNPGALPTERRAVKCDVVDALAFSYDGTQILGTTLHSSPPSTVVITAPYYDPGALAIDKNLSAMWTTSILFPNSSRDCSHAVLLQDGSQEEASWAFAYDRSFETFRAVRIDDLRNGTTYFTGPVPKTTSQAKLLPCTPPSATYRGELASAGFQGSEVWVYGVPEDLAAVSEAAPSDNAPLSPGLARRNSAQGSSSRPPSTRTQDAATAAATAGRVPQWQILCDKLRNNFVAGHKVSEVAGVSNVKWVSGFGDTSFQERLVITARGITAPRLVTEDEDMNFADGGIINLLDFDYALMNGTKREITIEVGTSEAEVLEEEQRDIEAEVAIIRRRTVAQRRGEGGNALLRAAAAGAVKGSAAPPSPDEEDDPLVPRPIGRNRMSSQPLLEEPADDEYVPTMEEQEAMDAPYAHSSPRSGTTLRRAATAAAVNRRLNPVTADGRPIEYSRADGRREHPHESDADNWVPPPPPYQKEDPGDMPAFMRGPAVLPPISIPGMSMPPPVPIPIQHPGPSTFPDSPGHVVSAISADGPVQGVDQGTSLDQKPDPSQHRTASNSSTPSRLRVDELLPPRSRTSSTEDLYGVSRQGSPHDIEHQSEYSRLGRTPAVSPDSTRSEVRRSGVSFDMPSTSTATSGHKPMILPRVRNSVPRLELEASSITLPNLESNSGSAQPMRRLPNSQTWPLAPRPGGHDAESPPTAAADLATVALPPAPSPDQLERLNRRISQGNPRRLSGSLLTQQQQQLNSRRQSGQRAPEIRQPNHPFTTSSTSMPHQEVDQPLIISTPNGVSGAFDPPQQGISGRGDAPILAPIPRRPDTGGDARSRPTVERLETIYNVRSEGNLVAAAAAQDRNFLPSWMRSVSPARSFSMMSRRPSREKNTHDAKKRESKSHKRKSKKVDTEAASSAGWTDVSMASDSKENDKDKKCVVM